MRVLLLEDELMLQSAIVEYLESCGYIVEAYEDGGEAFEHIKPHRYDLFIFDINVPSIDGLNLLQKLQNDKIFVPTIFISAITKIEQITKAYELGCFDYLKKPFHLQELTLHIDRLMKRGDLCSKNHVRISQMYTYEISKQRIYFDGAEQTLTNRQNEIIHLLVSNIEKIVDFDMLRYYVWDRSDIDNATIRAEIHRVRAVLKEDIIEGIKGVGYRIKSQITKM